MTERRRAVIDVDWVDVDDEPVHLEKFRNDAVRVYEATIAPGAATMYHRHILDTLYVILDGGAFRSDEPGAQGGGTHIGTSVSKLRQLGWLLRRTLTGGWLSMPTGTVLLQPHARLPLIHRVIASAHNPRPVRMLGIELHRTGASGVGFVETAARLELKTDGATVYRIDRDDHRGVELELAHGGVLVTVSGTVRVTAGAGEREGTTSDLQAGAVCWLAPGRVIVAANTTPMCAIVVAL